MVATEYFDIMEKTDMYNSWFLFILVNKAKFVLAEIRSESLKGMYE